MAEERTQADDLKDAFEEHQALAEKAREENPAEPETEEEYYARVGQVPGVFGDVDTTAGPDAAGIEVPASNNEAATVAAAEVAADAEEGDEDAEDTSEAEARSQVSFGRVNPEAEGGEAAPADVSPEEADKVTAEDADDDKEDDVV